MASVALPRKQLASGRFVALAVGLASFALGMGGGYALGNHAVAGSNPPAAAVQVVDGPQSDLTRVLPSAEPVGGPDSDLTRVLPAQPYVGGPDSDLTRALPR